MKNIDFTPENIDMFGKINYDAYCGLRDWKSFKGEALPQWEKCNTDIKIGWRVAAMTVIGKYKDSTR